MKFVFYLKVFARSKRFAQRATDYKILPNITYPGMWYGSGVISVDFLVPLILVHCRDSPPFKA